jgi:phenylacetate-CoA ligase
MMGNRGYFDSLEEMSRQDRYDYTTINLAQSLKRSYERSATGRELFDKAGLIPGDIKSSADLPGLPITRKNDIIELEKRRPFAGFLTIPVEDVGRIFVTPGPIHEPLHTECISWFGRAFWAAGFRQGDVVVNTFSYHLSPGGLLFHEAIRQCGATAVPVGTGNTDILIRTMFDIKATGFVGTPSYLLGVIKKAEDMGHNWLKEATLRKAWFTGEMLTPSIRQTLEQDYGITTSQAYAVSEVGGALAYECSEKNGLHMMDEYVIEIVDPETGLVLEPDKTGEVVVTPIANPTWGLFRFGTGDLSAIKSEPCRCGRTSLMLGGITGRVGDAVKVRGVFLVGKQVEALFAGLSGISRVQAVVDRPGQRDELLVKIELKDGTINRQALSDDIARRFQAECLVRPDRIEFVEPGTIPEGSKTVSDMRKWQ